MTEGVTAWVGETCGTRSQEQTRLEVSVLACLATGHLSPFWDGNPMFQDSIQMDSIGHRTETGPAAPTMYELKESLSCLDSNLRQSRKRRRVPRPFLCGQTEVYSNLFPLVAKSTPRASPPVFKISKLVPPSHR